MRSYLAILPDAAHLHARLVKPPDTWEIVYEEHFRHDDHDLRRETEQMLSNVPVRLSCWRDGRGGVWARIRARGLRTFVEDLMVGEFLHWSRAGQITLRDILTGKLTGTAPDTVSFSR